jgi:hypothetical protein
MLGCGLWQPELPARLSLSYGSCILSYTLQERVFVVETCWFTHSRLLPSRGCNMPNVKANPRQWSKVSSKMCYFQDPVATTITRLSLLISCCRPALRNECSVTKYAQLTQWKRTLPMESGRLTARYSDALPTTRNAESTRSWLGTVLTFRTRYIIL